MPPVTVVICCMNAEDTIGPACASVGWADELIVVDSGSTDSTAEIARHYADRFETEPWRGYGQQKAYATSLATHEWVLVLDSDETCTAELADEIHRLEDRMLERHDVFLMRRRNFVYGRHVRSWDPDWQSRFIHRDRAQWSDDVLHENRLPGSPERLSRLTGHIEHKRHSQAGFNDYFCGRRQDERLLMVGRQMYARGKRCSALDLALRPSLALLKQLILKRGILDGTFGLMLAQKTAVTTQLKYAALWAVQHGVDDTRDNDEETIEGPALGADAPQT